MNAIFRRRITAAELAIAATMLGACAMGNGSLDRLPAPTAASQSTETPAREPESKKESIRAPAVPVPPEYRTPEQAARHAADPKTPTGALIIKPPINVMPPDTPSSDPKQ